MLHTVQFVPVSLRGFNVMLNCDTRRIVGYRAVCRCGDRSKVTRSRVTLREWAALHREAVEVEHRLAEPVE